MHLNRFCSLLVLLLYPVAAIRVSADDFRVYPYLKNPAANSTTIRWFSDSATDGKLEVFSGDPTAGSDKAPIARLPSMSVGRKSRPPQRQVRRS